MEKAIVERLYAPTTDERPVPADMLRLTQGTVDALRLPKAGSASHAVVFFHGNKGNITWCTERMRALAAKYSTSHVWAFEYVGYGRLVSTKPNTERLVLGAYQFLSAIQKYYTSWVWYAEGLGAPIALGVLDGAAKLSYLPSSITMVNTFGSIGGMAERKQAGGGVMVKKLGYELNTAKYAKQVLERYGASAPTLRVVRTPGENEIPVEEAQEVATAARTQLQYVHGTETDVV